MPKHKEILSPTNYPELIHYESELGEPTKFGEALTIVGHPFAEPFDNSTLLELALESGLPPSEIDKAKQVITNTGFTNRYFSQLPNQEIDFERDYDRNITIGALLLQKILAANHWEDGIDVFIDTSAFLPNTINQAILEKAGLDSDQIYKRSYRFACAGAIGAFIDCLSDPALADSRIVIAALEPLSQIISPDHFLTPESLTIPSIFGDAHTLLAFNPKYFHLQNKTVLIQPDGGVIKVRTFYDFENTPSQPETIPPHYRFQNQGEAIFHHSGQGAFLDISSPTNGSTISMDGIGTGLFFGDQTTSVIIDLLTEYGDPHLLKQLGDKNIILHPASKPVVGRIAKLLRRHPNRYLDTPHLPFLMDKAKQSNSSSATSLNRWRYMIENDMVDPNLPFLWIAPGIGSAIAGAIGWIKP